MDMSIERNIFPKVEDIVEVSEVLANLLVTRKALSERPGVVDFGNVELVVWPFGVDTRSWVSIPIPDTAEVGARFNDKG